MLHGDRIDFCCSHGRTPKNNFNGGFFVLMGIHVIIIFKKSLILLARGKNIFIDLVTAKIIFSQLLFFHLRLCLLLFYFLIFFILIQNQSELEGSSYVFV